MRRPKTLFVPGGKLLQPLFGIVDGQHVDTAVIAGFTRFTREWNSRLLIWVDSKSSFVLLELSRGQEVLEFLFANPIPAGDLPAESISAPHPDAFLRAAGPVGDL